MFLFVCLFVCFFSNYKDTLKFDHYSQCSITNSPCSEYVTFYLTTQNSRYMTKSVAQMPVSPTIMIWTRLKCLSTLSAQFHHQHDETPMQAPNALCPPMTSGQTANPRTCYSWSNGKLHPWVSSALFFVRFLIFHIKLITSGNCSCIFLWNCQVQFNIFGVKFPSTIHSVISWEFPVKLSKVECWWMDFNYVINIGWGLVPLGTRPISKPMLPYRNTRPQSNKTNS